MPLAFHERALRRRVPPGTPVTSPAACRCQMLGRRRHAARHRNAEPSLLHDSGHTQSSGHYRSAGIDFFYQPYSTSSSCRRSRRRRCSHDFAPPALFRAAKAPFPRSQHRLPDAHRRGGTLMTMTALIDSSAVFEPRPFPRPSSPIRHGLAITRHRGSATRHGAKVRCRDRDRICGDDDYYRP